MAEYTNDLRIKEIGVGEEAGAWGTTLNTQLGVLAEGFSYGVENLGSDANATITMADGASDEARSLYLKITSTSLSATRTVTLAPQSVSKVWIIENATTGSQSITITQGGGQHGVTIPNGQVKMIYTTGDSESPSGAYDALDGLQLGGAATAVTSVTAPLIEASTSVQTPLIEYTDGDDAITIADGGGITAANGITSTAAANTFGATSFNDADITNVGSISLDTIVSDASPAAITVGYGPADTLTVNGLTTMTTDGNGDTLTLISTDADANVGPALNLYRNSSSPADSDFLGNIKFNGRNDNSQDVQYGEIEFYAADVSDGTEDGWFNANIITGGTNISYMQMKGGTGVVFNEDSNDIDFRIESNGQTHMLFVDGGADCVNIGGSTDQGGTLNIEGADSDMLVLHRTADTGDQSMLFKDHGDHNATITGKNGGGLAFATNGNTTAITIDSSQNTDFSGSLVIHGDADTGVNAQSGTAGLMMYVSSPTAYVTATSTGNNHRNLELSGSNTGVRNGNQLHLSYTGGVGIGTSSPSHMLVAKGAAGTSPAIEMINSDTEDGDTGRETSLRFSGLRSGGEAAINAQITGSHSGTADDDKGMLIFYTNNGSGLTERARMPDSGGITFNGDTAAANALDDYEEGTFTPVFFGTTQSVAMTNYGYYRKIGSLVFFTFYSGAQTFSSSSGSAGFAGLPFTSISGTYSPGSVAHANCCADNDLQCYVGTGASSVYFLGQGATSATTMVDGASKYAMVSGWYPAA